MFTVLGVGHTILSITFDPVAQNILTVRYYDVKYTGGGTVGHTAVGQRHVYSRDTVLRPYILPDPNLDMLRSSPPFKQ